MEGNREVGEVCPEGIVLGVCHVLLKNVMEHHPIQTNTHLRQDISTRNMSGRYTDISL